MLANGTMRTIEDDEDIYVSLTQLCEYFAQSTKNMTAQVEDIDPADNRYAQGLLDMMHTIAYEMIQLGKFEAQRRMIDSPEDLLKMIDKNPFGRVE